MRFRWQCIPLLQIRTLEAEALQDLGVWISQGGYQIHPVISWDKGKPVVESWSLYRPAARPVARRRLSFIRYCGSLDRAKDCARADYRTRRTRPGRGAVPVE